MESLPKITTLRKFRQSTAFITFVIAYAVFTDQFLFAAIIPFYPYSLRERLHIREDKVQFWLAIFLGTFGIACVLASIPWGLYTDRSTSRRWPFMTGLLILFSATLLLWFTTTLAGQVAGRILQGVASVVVWTSGLAVLVDTVGPSKIGEYMGWITIALNAGSLVAPSLGGIVFAKAGYHAVFGVIVGIVGVDILLRAVMLEKNKEMAGVERMEELGVAVGSGTVEEMDEFGKCSGEIRKTVTFGTVEEVSPEEPTEPGRERKIPPIIRLICSARFIAALWGIMVLATVFSGFQATLPLFVHDTFQWDAIGGGLIFIPLSFPAVFGPIVGKYTDRYGGRWFAVSGFLLFAISLILLRLVDHNSTGQNVLLCGLLVLVGSCMALLMEPLFAEITHGAARLAEEDRLEGHEPKVGYFGSAYAWFNIAWCTGNFVGPLAAGLIMEAAGWKTMTWVLGLLSGVSVLPAGLWCGGWYFAKAS